MNWWWRRYQFCTRIYIAQSLEKADLGLARRAAPPPCLNIMGVFFVNFWLYNTHTLWFKSTYNIYNMYFIQYFYYKNIGNVWRGIKTNARPKRDRTPWFWNFWIRHWLVPCWLFLLCMHDVIWSFSACRNGISSVKREIIPIISY